MFRSLLSNTLNKGYLKVVSRDAFNFSKAPNQNSRVPSSLAGFSLHKARTYPRSTNVIFSRNHQGFKRLNVRAQSEDSYSEHAHKPSILGGSLSFALIGSVLCFVAASLVFQNKPSRTQLSLEKGKKWFADNFNDNSIRPYQHHETSFEFLIREFKGRVNLISSRWEDLPRHEKAIWGIIGLNTLVFVAWRIPRFQPFMTKHFLHVSDSDKYYTMITSAFSHKELWHLGFNMMALKGFGASAGSFISAENLVAFYLTTGILSSLVRRVAFSAFPHKVSLNPLIPSLGASGAIFGLVSFVAYQVPHSKAGIIFLPGVNFELSELLACFMTLDFIGVVRGWRVFDHYAHLGGALFGLAYSKWGIEYIWIPINKTIYKIRVKLSKIL